MKLKSTLALSTAATIVDEALRTGRENAMHPLTVVVLDSGGRIVAAKSEDGSGILRFDIALGKGWGALGMGISSRLIRDRLSKRVAFQNALAAASDGKFVPVPGGVLIVDGEGFTIGAVGISGDTSEKDEYCAITSIKAAGLQSEPADVDAHWKTSSLSDADHESQSKT
ncbi:MAG: heme-binding protein [Pseudomonadota bacterium]